jgi:hypothetical protein
MTEPVMSATCLSWAGERWKFLTRRRNLLGAALHGDGARVWERRPYLECQGTGEVSVRSS